MTNARASPAEPLLELLDPDPNRAREKYLRLFHKLARFFEWRNCADPENLAAEALYRCYSRIAQGTAMNDGNPEPYLNGIKNYLLKEEWRSRRRVAVPLDEQALPVRPMEAVERRVCLDQLLGRLAADDRNLLKRYHHTEDRAALARELGMKPGALRTKISRMLDPIRQPYE